MFVTRALANPDLQIRGGGHPDPEIKGGGGGDRSPKKFFSALRASVWSKHKGGGPCPGSATAGVSQIVSSFRLIFLKFLLLKKLTFSSDEAHQINPMTIISRN